MSVFLFHGVSDDLVDFTGQHFSLDYPNDEEVMTLEYDCMGEDGFVGKVTAENGEFILLHATYGEDGVEWKLRVQNPSGWLIERDERPDYEGDPALKVTAPGRVTIEQYDILWDDPAYDFTVV